MNFRTVCALLSPKASTAAAVLPLVVFRAAGGGFPIIIGLYIAHRWGLRELAAYSVASALVAVALVLTDWGCSRLLPREIAIVQRGRAAVFVAQTNGVRVVLVLACLAAVAAGSWFHFIEADVSVYTFLLLPCCAVAIVSTNGVSERVVSGNVHAISAAVIAGVVVFVATAFPLLKSFGGNGHALVVAYLIGKCVEAAVLMRGRLWMARTIFGGIGHALISLWPFSVQAIFGAIHSRLPIFVIEHMGSRYDVGLVSAGLALRNMLLLLPASMALLSYPALAVAARDRDVGRMRRIVTAYLYVCTAGVLAGIGLLIAFINRICLVLRIPPEQESFTIVFVAVGITTIGTALVGVALQAFGGEHVAARLSLIALVFSGACYGVAVEYWGVWGTVWGLLGGEIAALVLVGRAALRLKNSRFSSESLHPSTE
jgi:O-antigen/teichoic acid export membrane protein